MKDRERKLQLLKLAIAVLAVVTITKIGYDMKWFDVAMGICKLETDKSKRVHKVSLKALSFVTLKENEEAIHEQMGSMGWTFFRSYGRGYIFSKDGYEVLLSKKNILGRYTFYEVASKDVFDVI